MTHDELLELINRKNHSQGAVIHVDTFRDALRAVVKLHRPISLGEALNGGDELACAGCHIGTSQYGYPCPTIQAIEKELA